MTKKIIITVILLTDGGDKTNKWKIMIKMKTMDIQRCTKKEAMKMVR